MISKLTFAGGGVLITSGLASFLGRFGLLAVSESGVSGKKLVFEILVSKNMKYLFASYQQTGLPKVESRNEKSCLMLPLQLK
jgi:hypothetical protein